MGRGLAKTQFPSRFGLLGSSFIVVIRGWLTICVGGLVGIVSRSTSIPPFPSLMHTVLVGIPSKNVWAPCPLPPPPLPTDWWVESIDAVT